MVSRAYASGTDVPVSNSRAEIEHTVERFGATGYLYGWQGDEAVVQFCLGPYTIRFILTLPAKDDHRFTRTPTGKPRAPQAAAQEWEKACREQWRALALIVKAKLVAVESGIVTIEGEFAAQIVMADGRPAGDALIPALREYAASDQSILPGRLVAAITSGQES